MKHVIPRMNWTDEVADAIGRAEDGDTIIVHEDAEKQLGMRAAERMCPDKRLTFEVMDG